MASQESSRPLNLLLLPPPPRPLTHDSLKAAYEKPIVATFKLLTFERRNESEGSILDIAVPIPTLASARVRSRSKLYDTAQKFIAGLYNLVCVAAAREGINIEDVKGIDVRVLALNYAAQDEEVPKDNEISKQPEASGGSTSSVTDTVVGLQTLAQSQRPWNYIIGIECEEGEKMLRDFLTSQEQHLKIKKVPGGIVHVDLNAPDAVEVDESAPDDQDQDYRSVAVGGTFDHMHVGHKLLLTMFAFVLAKTDAQLGHERRLTVGITGDDLLKNKKYAELLESWDDRQRIVLNFLRAILDFRPPNDATVKTDRKSQPGPNGHAVLSWLGDLCINCVQLSDPFGPTITEEDISALVVSAETRSGGKAINDKRSEKGWSPLEVFEIDVLNPDEFGNAQAMKESFEGKLSSTAIREQLSQRAKDSYRS